MQNKPNFPQFCAKNGYLGEKQTQTNPIQSQSNPIQTQFKPNQTQFRPNQTQFFALFILPMLPIHPN